MTGVFLFKAALAVYLACVVVYGASLWGRRVMPAKIGAGLMALALVIHSLAFASRWFSSGRDTVIGLHDAFSFFAWALAAAYLLLQIRTKTRVLGAFVSPVIALMMGVASGELGGTVRTPEVLQGALVTLHVLLSVTGEALFALASCAGLMYLTQDRLLRRKRPGGLSRLLPSLQDLDRINHICLLWGFPLLTLGGLIGSVWAGIVWGSPWQWDPKQVWTLLAWAVYGFLLHQRLAIGWRGRTAARWSLAAFVVLIVLMLVGTRFFPSLHQFV